MRKNRKGNPPPYVGWDAKSSSSNEGAFGNPREIAREARSTDPGSTCPQHMKGYRRKTEAGNETTLKENGPYSRSMPAKRRKHGPETRNEGLEKHASPHRAIPAIVENVENLEFIRKSRWKNIETRGFQLLKTVSRQAIDQAIKHAHGFQHASEQAFSVLYGTIRIFFVGTHN